METHLDTNMSIEDVEDSISFAKEALHTAIYAAPITYEDEWFYTYGSRIIENVFGEMVKDIEHKYKLMYDVNIPKKKKKKKK